ncbi:MAG TPA: LysE family transporter [Rubrivivax sp.]
MDWSTWLAFFAASWAISLSPGPGAVAAMSAGLSHGFARGYWMSLGMVLGILTQVLVVSLGLGALMAASASAFAALKWAGVLYLLYLGVQQWRAPALALEAKASGAPLAPRRTLVGRGWLLNALNPKCTVFMIAVVPQFVATGQPLLPQYAAIAATLAFTDLVVFAAYTGLASRLLGALRTPSQRRWTNRVFGTLFVGMALLLATFRRSG